MEVTAVIVRILDTKEIGASNFKSRSVHVKTEGQYEQTLEIKFIQERTEALNIFSPGDKVKIAINLKGREWKNAEGEISVFNTIEGWKIEKVA